MLILEIGYEDQRWWLTGLKVWTLLLSSGKDGLNARDWTILYQTQNHVPTVNVCNILETKLGNIFANRTVQLNNSLANQ